MIWSVPSAPLATEDLANFRASGLVGRGRTVPVVARVAAPASLVSAFVVLALVLVAALSEQSRSRSAAAGSALTSVYPALHTVADLGAPAAARIDSGMGIFPALSAPEGLLFPSEAAVERARRYASSRRGEVSFAVADDRGGLTGVNTARPYASASLTKAMILVAYLRKLAAAGAREHPDELTLGYMIRLSDNASADEIYGRVGDESLRELARRARMDGFRIAGDWANATLTPADQARFFMALDRLVPRRFRGLARNLLETVVAPHSWGIPAGARPGWRVYFKGGWRPEAEGELVHQAGLLERGSRRVAIAVLSSENPDMLYGERSIQGVTERLLAGGDAPLLAIPASPQVSLRQLSQLAGE